MPILSATEIAFLLLACQQVVLAAGWGVSAIALQMERRSIVQWSGYALLTAVSLLLFIWATQTRREEIRAIGNVCVVAGVMLMQRGVRQFVGRPAPIWIYALILAGAMMVSVLGAQARHGSVRVGVISGLLGLICLATAWDIFSHARRQVERRWNAWLALPLLLGSLVFLARGGRALVSPETVVHEVNSNTSLNMSSAFAFLVTALLFHMALVALVGSRLMQELRRLSRYDSLTELLNRRAIDDLLQDEAKRAVRMNRPFSVLMIDADYFKSINDRLGHAAGDEALRHLAQILRSQMRDVDRVGRFGGEEFIALLPATSANEALHAAERLRDALLRRPFVWQGETLRLTVSTGVAAWRGSNDEVSDLLKRADAALYRAKALGRDRFEFDQ